MTFEEVLYKLGEETEKIEVCASGCYGMNGKSDVAIRTGNVPAGVDFHDPVIDGKSFMICGDIYHCADYERVDKIADVEAFPENLLVRLRAVYYSCPSIYAQMDLGIYDILKSEVVEWDDFATVGCVKLTLKRRGS